MMGIAGEGGITTIERHADTLHHPRDTITIGMHRGINAIIDERLDMTGMGDRCIVAAKRPKK